MLYNFGADLSLRRKGNEPAEVGRAADVDGVSRAPLTGICSSRGGQTRSGGGSSYVIKHFSSQQEIPLLTKNSAVLGSSDSHPDLVSYSEEPSLKETQFKNQRKRNHK